MSNDSTLMLADDNATVFRVEGADIIGPLAATSTAAAATATTKAAEASASAASIFASVVALIVPSLSGGIIDAAGYVGGAIDDSGRAIVAATTVARLVPSVAAGVSTLLHVLIHGQSNSFSWAVPALDTVPLDPPGRALAFPGGVPHVGSTYPPLAYLTDAALGQMVDLRGSTAPRGGIGMRIGSRIIADGQAVLMSGHGVGGQSYAGLKKGTLPFANMVRAMQAARDQAFNGGLGYVVPFAVWVQGDDNYADSKATYLAHLIEIQADVERAARAIMGDSAAVVPLYLAQPSCWTGYGAQATTSGVPLAQVQAGIDQPTKFVAVTPFYPFTHTDGVHLDANGNRSLDDLIGWVRSRATTGLFARSAARAGAAVTVTCQRPAGAALAIRTNRVTDPGQLGLVYRDASGASVPISNIAVAGDTVTFTIASAVGGTIGFGTEGISGQPGGPMTGPRCCICATTGETLPNGDPLDLYMLHCSVGVL